MSKGSMSFPNAQAAGATPKPIAPSQFGVPQLGVPHPLAPSPGGFNGALPVAGAAPPPRFTVGNGPIAPSQFGVPQLGVPHPLAPSPGGFNGALPVAGTATPPPPQAFGGFGNGAIGRMIGAATPYAGRDAVVGSLANMRPGRTF